MKELDIKTIKEMLLKILEKSNKIRYEDVDIYFVNENQFREITALHMSVQNLRGATKKDPFFHIAKLINLDPALYYKLFIKHKYKNITDKDKVKEKINTTHLIEINKIRKNTDLIRENTEDKDRTNEFIKKLKEEEKDKINLVIERKNFLLSNFDSLDIRITSFNDKTIYPTIKIIDIHEKEIMDHLRNQVPNIVYAHKNIELIDNEFRKESKHIQFVLNAEHAYGKIYYKEGKRK